MNKLTARSCNLVQIPVRRTRTGENFSISSLLFNDGDRIVCTSGITAVSLHYDKDGDVVLAHNYSDPTGPILYLDGGMVVEVLR